MSDLTGLFIALCWALFLVFIVVAKLSTKRVVESDRRWIYSSIGLVVFVAVIFLAGRHPYLSGLVVGAIRRPSTPIVGYCADMIVAAGLAVSLWARIELGRNWNLNPSIQEDHELIERGPYVYVRHPMYSGLLLMLLGAVIWYGSWVGIIFLVACLIGTWLKLREEERLLTGHFGPRYPAYKERVRALIPFVL